VRERKEERVNERVTEREREWDRGRGREREREREGGGERVRERGCFLVWACPLSIRFFLFLLSLTLKRASLSLHNEPFLFEFVQ